MSWSQSVGPSRNILPFDNGIAGRNRNNYKNTVRDTVYDCVETIAAINGHALPVPIRRIDGKYVELCLDADNFNMLTTQHRITSLYGGFVAKELLLDRVYLNILRQIISCEFPHIQVSLRTRGIYDTCFIYLESIRTLAPVKFGTKAEEWKCHLDVTR